MKTIIFAKRNFKELVRDPLSLIFAIVLPLFLLFIFQQFKIPSSIYNIENFTPSIIVFSYSFISLFTALLVSKDRSTSFLMRLFSSPLTIFNYIGGYSLAIVPIAIIQSALFLAVASLYGLPLSMNTLLVILVMIPVALLFVGFGILIGCSFNDKTASGVSSIIVQLVAFTSGMWFDVAMVGKVFQAICNILPFKYTVDLARSVINSNLTNAYQPVLIIIIYIIIVYSLSLIVFKKQMQK